MIFYHLSSHQLKKQQTKKTRKRCQSWNPLTKVSGSAHDWDVKYQLKLENLMVLRHSPDLFNSVQIGQGQLQLIIKYNLFEHILKRKSYATVFNPFFLPHGLHEANFLIISCVPAH